MANQYGIGLSPLTERIYIGKQNDKTRMWVRDKRDITSEFIATVLAWLPAQTSRTIEGGDVRSILMNLPETEAGITAGIKGLQKMLDKLTSKNNNDEKK